MTKEKKRKLRDIQDRKLNGRKGFLDVLEAKMLRLEERMKKKAKRLTKDLNGEPKEYNSGLPGSISKGAEETEETDVEMICSY